MHTKYSNIFPAYNNEYVKIALPNTMIIVSIHHIRHNANKNNTFSLHTQGMCDDLGHSRVYSYVITL